MNKYYNKCKVLVTGHTGFKGSWLTNWLNLLGAEVYGISLPEEENNLHYKKLKLNNKSSYIDIRDFDSLKKCIETFEPTIIFHLAAQALVRKSYNDPRETYETNVIGTLNLYEAAKNIESIKAIVSVTSDKVYQNLEKEYQYKESDKLGGFDPYSSSKACAEIMTESYRKSFFSNNKNSIKLATVRAGNVIGGGDWSEDRLIPDLIKSVKKDSATLIRNPNSIRPWQHVLDPLYGYLLVGQKLLNNENFENLVWNFGPTESKIWKVHDVLIECKKNWSKINWELQKVDQNLLHEANTLMLDSTKAKNELSWNPVWDTSEAIKRTIDWYHNMIDGDNIITESQIKEYLSEVNLS